MSLILLGQPPFAKNSQGKLVSRIGTFFPASETLVTLPGIHATQRQAYLDALERQRQEAGLEPLSGAEYTEAWNNAVDLILDDGLVFIRPDPKNMDLAFQADELLQELVPKHRIRFLHVLTRDVRESIKRRGECWRITPLPRTIDEMKEMIAGSRIGIGGREIYYYNRTTGTRLLTCQEFCQLCSLPDDELRRHLAEIRAHSAKLNAQRSPEIGFFAADNKITKADFAPHDFAGMPPEQLRTVYEELRQRYFQSVRPDLRQDAPDSAEWRNRMMAALLAPNHEEVPEETLLGLSPEFRMSILWLPGGRIEDGELIFDPIFEQWAGSHDEELDKLCDDKVRKFICNFVREYGDLEYVNVGRVIGSLSRRPAARGRRDVYVAEVKLRGQEQEIVHIIRMQKWTVREHLDAGRPLVEAMMRSEEYTEYILDRRLGCRQLWMNLPSRIVSKKISEWYLHDSWAPIPIWTPYFERDYIRGIATDKLAEHRFQNNEFALIFARLLGQAAAPNMIVGRCDLEGKVLFDDGDEVLLEDERGMPEEIVVADHTGTFADFLSDLSYVAPDYAQPINRRLQCVPQPETFLDTYLDAFVERFQSIQHEYHKRRKAFDSLFKHHRAQAGNFADRWEKVLARLERTDPVEIARAIRENIRM